MCGLYTKVSRLSSGTLPELRIYRQSGWVVDEGSWLVRGEKERWIGRLEGTYREGKQ